LKNGSPFLLTTAVFHRSKIQHMDKLGISSHRKDSVPEIWGGIESTINRIGDRYFDQLLYSGHYDREEDIDLFASLGIKALRYPVLWEKHQPEKDTVIDWAFAEKRLNRIRASGIRPIAGLVHHGSGPAFTDLLDNGFAPGLAAYAEQVATKFPWLEYYTPVNEPLTTARFSGLYGLWYPHHKKDISFARILLNELKATVLAMQAIRRINPDAKLVQTEDLAKTYSTPVLSFQATFENERRWLSFDLLCGKLLPYMPMYQYLLRLGIAGSELQFFIDNPCPPDIIGANYYITSERFLDERLHRYPLCTHGGNEVLEYADVEAVRVAHQQPWGLEVLLREAWHRFHLPLSVTESHLNCTREEQLRWFSESWNTVQKLSKSGINIKAITCWSLLGAFGWDQLLTSPSMNYETGVFDISSGKPRATALAELVRAAATNNDVHPLCHQKGWWQRCQSKDTSATDHFSSPADRLVLILGDKNDLALALEEACTRRNIPYVFEPGICIGNDGELEKIVQVFSPWAVICTNDPGEKMLLPSLCAQLNIRCMLLTMSRAAQNNCDHVLRVGLAPGNKDEVVSVDAMIPLIDWALDLLIDDEKGAFQFNHFTRAVLQVQ
jgi:dTDP-4-dehydrorhamnose reductase